MANSEVCVISPSGAMWPSCMPRPPAMAALSSRRMPPRTTSAPRATPSPSSHADRCGSRDSSAVRRAVACSPSSGCPVAPLLISPSTSPSHLTGGRRSRPARRSRFCTQSTPRDSRTGRERPKEPVWSPGLGSSGSYALSWPDGRTRWRNGSGRSWLPRRPCATRSTATFRPNRCWWATRGLRSSISIWPATATRRRTSATSWRALNATHCAAT